MPNRDLHERLARANAASAANLEQNADVMLARIRATRAAYRDSICLDDARAWMKDADRLLAEIEETIIRG